MGKVVVVLFLLAVAVAMALTLPSQVLWVLVCVLGALAVLIAVEFSCLNLWSYSFEWCCWWPRPLVLLVMIVVGLAVAACTYKRAGLVL